MSFYAHKFEAPVVYHDVGSTKYAYTVVFVPENVAKTLPLDQYPRLRITGEVNDYPIEASLTPVRGRWYILVSKKLLSAIRTHIGDEVSVRFNIADQNAVTVPDALRLALSDNEDMNALWEAQTPGKQRGLAYKVASAKTEATIQKRIEEIFAILRGEIDLRGKPLV